jgi:hypothetical protein
MPIFAHAMLAQTFSVTGTLSTYLPPVDSVKVTFVGEHIYGGTISGGTDQDSVPPDDENGFILQADISSHLYIRPPGT